MLFHKPISTELDATDSAGVANNVGHARIVRVVNTSTSAAHLVSLVDSAGSAIGTFSLPANGLEIIEKRKTDKIFAANTAIKLSKIGYPQG